MQLTTGNRALFCCLNEKIVSNFAGLLYHMYAALFSESKRLVSLGMSVALIFYEVIRHD